MGLRVPDGSPGGTRSAATLDTAGTVLRTFENAAFPHGFRLELEGPGGRTSVEVRTFVPVPAPAAPGQRLKVLARSMGADAQVRLEDDGGVRFAAFAGSSPPDGKGLPLEVRPVPRRAWVEVRSTDDLCRWTVAHRPVEVLAKGAVLALLTPGRQATVQSEGRRYRVVVAVSSSPEESDCGREGEPRLAYFWWRL